MVDVEQERIAVRAVSRYARVAPNKARQVIAHIRGRQVDDARRILELSEKGIAGQILKTLNSAVANAEHNNGLDSDDLLVSAAVVDEGPTLKRYQPRAMGRAFAIRKRTSHITITVGPKPTPRARPAAAKRSRASAPPTPGGSPASEPGERPGSEE